jgi:hypothetical protein
MRARRQVRRTRGQRQNLGAIPETASLDDFPTQSQTRLDTRKIDGNAVAVAAQRLRDNRRRPSMNHR